MEFALPAVHLEFLILGSLDRQDSYGYEICRQIKTVAEIREPSLYPILKNLKAQELITSYEEIHHGRKRKYYHLTDKGKTRLKVLREDWAIYTSRIEQIVSQENLAEKEGNEE